MCHRVPARAPPNPAQLIALPYNIGGCTALLRLGLKGNRLAALPTSVGNLSSLVELYLTGAAPAAVVLLTCCF